MREKEAAMREKEAAMREKEAAISAADARVYAAETASSRYTFLTRLKKPEFTDRASMLAAIESAEFKQVDSFAIAVPNTDRIVKDTQSQVSRHTGCINMSTFRKRFAANTDDAMNVRHFVISRENLLKPLKEMCILLSLDFDAFLGEEVEVVTSIRSALSWLTDNVCGMDEDSVQRVFTLYIDGLLKKLNLVDFQAVSVNGIELSAKILVTKKSGVVVSKELRGKSDLCITFGEHQSKKSGILETRSVTVEMKYRRFRTAGGISESTCQQLAQIFAIFKMRELSSGNPPVRSILTDFMQLRISIGLERETSGLNYFISSLYDDPVDFIGALVLILTDSISSITDSDVVEVNDAEFGEDNGMDHFDDDIDNEDGQDGQDDEENCDAENRDPKRDVGSDINQETAVLGQPVKSQQALPESFRKTKRLRDFLTFSSDDDDKALERERKICSLEIWDGLRFGRPYLCAEALLQKR